MPVAKGPAGIRQELGKFKAGTLHSGSASGRIVTNPRQTIAIALSEQRKATGGNPTVDQLAAQKDGAGLPTIDQHMRRRRT